MSHNKQNMDRFGKKIGPDSRPAPSWPPASSSAATTTSTSARSRSGIWPKTTKVRIRLFVHSGAASFRTMTLGRKTFGRQMTRDISITDLLIFKKLFENSTFVGSRRDPLLSKNENVAKEMFLSKAESSSWVLKFFHSTIFIA